MQHQNRRSFAAQPLVFAAVRKPMGMKLYFVHPLGLGKADRTTYQAFDSRPQPDVLAP